MLTNKRKDIEQ